MSSMEFPSHASTGAGGTGAGAVLSRPVGDFSCPVLWVVSHHSGIFPFPSRTPPLLDWPPHSVAVPCPRSWRTLGAAIPAPGRGSASSGLPWGQSRLSAAEQSSPRGLCASLLCSLPRDHFPEAGEDGAGAAGEELPELHGVSVATGTAGGSLGHPCGLALLQRLPGAGEEGWKAGLSCGKGEESGWGISRGLGWGLWAPHAGDPAGLRCGEGKVSSPGSC